MTSKVLAVVRAVEWLDLCVREGRRVHHDLLAAGLTTYAQGVSIAVDKLERWREILLQGVEARALEARAERRTWQGVLPG